MDGRVVRKASTRVASGADIVVEASDHYVSRAAWKLVTALDAFDVDPAGRTVLDAGASTGGFSQVLLERGAATVIAVDVGHDQLAPDLRDAPGLVLVEGCNVRDLTPEVLADLSGVAERPSLVTADLSFISLRTVLPALRATAADDAEFVLLVKPQFEVGRTGVKAGVVRDDALRADAVMDVLEAAAGLGLGTAGVVSSPVQGTHGNIELLAWLRADGGSDPSQWRELVAAETKGGRA
ncbi:16S/23S rRNA (cytidine-2'-O)-methyltransferase [Agromyces mangrovi Wang et al. 2018]|nr:16S/23S rRNA (cytidine-2'-O)-methyltransferase [Agromyces mangrovi]